MLSIPLVLQFSQLDHSNFCLSYAFTFRNLSDFQGIAWIKGHDSGDPDSVRRFGYCAEADTCAGRPYFRNCGVVNFHLVNGLMSVEAARNVFVHELGHSLGATHDSDERCTPLKTDHYLMSANAKKIVLGETNNRISQCSSLEIGLNLDRVTCWNRKGRVQEASRPTEEPKKLNMCSYAKKTLYREKALGHLCDSEAPEEISYAYSAINQVLVLSFSLAGLFVLSAIVAYLYYKRFISNRDRYSTEDDLQSVDLIGDQRTKPVLV